jgi:hypothetical protein
MLLVHGFLASPRVVGWLAARLGRSGYCVHGVDLGGLFGRFNPRPVEELARRGRAGRTARSRPPGKRIDLVGHSEAGLIGRYHVQKLDGARRVRHLVTLGIPHRGTRWAYSGHLVRHVLPGLRQMAPGSPLLRDLADDRFPDSVRLTSIYSQRDSICPPLSRRLETRGAPHLMNVAVAGGDGTRLPGAHPVDRGRPDSEAVLSDARSAFAAGDDAAAVWNQLVIVARVRPVLELLRARRRVDVALLEDVPIDVPSLAAV